jgi:alpha-1,2-mannosyltransferase
LAARLLDHATGTVGRSGSRPPREPVLPRALLIPGVVLAAASLAVWIVWVAHHPSMWLMLDLRIYREAGSAAAHGNGLYTDYYSSAHLPFTYPPFAALLFAGIPGSMSFRTVQLAITVCGMLSLGAVTWLSWGKLGYRSSAGRAGATALTMAFALWTEPVQQTFSFGQINLILMAAVVIDLCLPERSRGKGILIGLAAGFKLTPAIFIAYLFCTRRYRAGLTSIAAFCVSVAGCFLILPAESRQYWDGLFFDSSRVGSIDYVGDQSLHGWITRVFDGGSATQPVWLAAAAIVGVAGLLLATWQYRAGNELLSIFVTAVTGLLVSPISWSHHWVWIAVALVLAADQAWRRTRVRDVLLLVVLFALFASWFQRVDNSGSGLIPMGLIWRVPFNNNLEYTWHGIQLIQGDMYTYLGLLFLLCLGVNWGRTRRRTANSTVEAPTEGAVTSS